MQARSRRRRVPATTIALVLAASAIALMPGAPANATDDSRPGFDRNGDGASDFAVLRQTSDTAYTWYWNNVTSFNADVFGNPEEGDIPLAGDFDGDGINDAAVYRPGTPASRWIVLLSGSGILADVPFGNASLGDIPLTGDIEGDGRTDFLLWRPGSPSEWFVRSATGLFGNVAFGDTEAYDDSPALGDMDGDGRADIIIRRIAADDTTTFFIRTATGRFPAPIHFGEKGDVYVPGDYNGDGKGDLAVVGVTDDGDYEWFFQFADGTFLQLRFGDTEQGDMLVQNDYNGNGFTDIAVWRPGTPGGLFIQPMPFGPASESSFGASGDTPLGFWFNCFQNIPTCD